MKKREILFYPPNYSQDIILPLHAPIAVIPSFSTETFSSKNDEVNILSKTSHFTNLCEVFFFCNLFFFITFKF